MKIAWFSHDSAFNGAELSMLEAVEGLAAAGEKLHVVLPAKSELVQHLQRHGAVVSVIPYAWWVGSPAQRSLTRRSQRFFSNVVAFSRVRQFLELERPDLVITNTLSISIAALAARSVGLPHLWYVHEMYGAEGHNVHFDWGEGLSLKLIDRLSNVVLTNSHAVSLQMSRSLPAKKIRVVYYGVTTKARLEQPRGAVQQGEGFRVIVVGRMSHGKRQEDAVRAIALLARSGLDVRLSLVGAPTKSYGPLLQTLVRDLAIEDRVTFIAHTDDPFWHVARANLSVMCSQGEAFGRVTVEAMKMGKAVVGADSGGTRELIRHGWNGLLYRAGDAEDLAQKIELVHGDQALLDRMAANASRWANEVFSLSRYTRELQTIFEEARCVSS